MASRCTHVRDAISALADGEAAPLGRRDIDEHVASCPACEGYERQLAGLTRRVRLAAAPVVPDRTATILAAIGRERAAAAGPSRPLRIALALIGSVQLLAAVPLLFGLGDLAVHAGRELAAFEVALAVGFLVSAWHPQRAAGVLPIAAVVAGLTVTSGVLDVVAGRAVIGSELPHVLEAGGVAVLWATASATGRTGDAGRRRLGAA